MDRGIEPHHIEVTSEGGGSKWIRGVVSHTTDEIKEALENNEIIHLVDGEGGQATVDMDRVFMIRFQDDEVFKRRSKRVNRENGRRRS